MPPGFDLPPTPPPTPDGMINNAGRRFQASSPSMEQQQQQEQPALPPTPPPTPQHPSRNTHRPRPPEVSFGCGQIHDGFKQRRAMHEYMLSRITLRLTECLLRDAPRVMLEMLLSTSTSISPPPPPSPPPPSSSSSSSSSSSGRRRRRRHHHHHHGSIIFIDAAAVEPMIQELAWLRRQETALREAAARAVRRLRSLGVPARNAARADAFVRDRQLLSRFLVQFGGGGHEDMYTGFRSGRHFSGVFATHHARYRDALGLDEFRIEFF